MAESRLLLRAFSDLRGAKTQAGAGLGGRPSWEGRPRKLCTGVGLPSRRSCSLLERPAARPAGFSTFWLLLYLRIPLPETHNRYLIT